MRSEDPDTLVAGLYVKIGDEIGRTRWLGRPPKLRDSELVCLAVAQALLGFVSEARGLRFARSDLAAMFPYLPERPGGNRRLRAAMPLVKKVICPFVADAGFWFDNHWIIHSTPVPCGMSRRTVKQSDMAAWADMGAVPRTPGSTGACACSWSAPRPGCRSLGPWPVRRSASGRYWPPCRPANPI